MVRPQSREEGRPLRDPGRLPERLTLLGEALWIAAYAAGLYSGWLSGRYAFPPAATILNVAWEFVFSVWWPHPRRLTRYIYRSWFALDLALLAQLLWFGTADGTGAMPRMYFRGLVLLGLAAAVALHAAAFRRFGRANLQAYVINLVMSALFLALYFERAGEGLSLTVAWTKFLGTFSISVANVVAWVRIGALRTSLVLVLLLVSVLDVAYLALLLAG